MPRRSTPPKPGTRSMRELIAAIHGGTVPESAVREGISQLERTLAGKFNRRAEQQARAEEQTTRVLGPIFRLIEKDGPALAAVRARRKVAGKIPKLPPPSFHVAEEQVRAGSLLTVVSTPYSADWSSGSGSTASGVTSGGGFGYKDEGRFGASAFIGSGGSAWGAGGIGASIRPLTPNTILRFTALVRYSYSWEDSSSGYVAHDDGFIGIYVWSFDLRGQDGRVEADQRSSLWSDGTGWFEDHSDSGEDELLPYAQSTIYLPVTSDRFYTFWVWTEVSGDATDGDIFGSFSRGALQAAIPFVVFEQWT